MLDNLKENINNLLAESRVNCWEIFSKNEKEGNELEIHGKKWSANWFKNFANSGTSYNPVDY